MYLQCSGTRAIQGTATARCCAKAGREGWRKKSHNPAAGATVGKSTKRAGTQDSNVLREEEESRATYPMAKFVTTCGSVGISLLLFSFYPLMILPIVIYTSTFQSNTYTSFWFTLQAL